MSLKWKTVWIAGNVRGNVLLNLIRHRAIAIVLMHAMCRCLQQKINQACDIT